MLNNWIFDVDLDWKVKISKQLDVEIYRSIEESRIWTLIEKASKRDLSPVFIFNWYLPSRRLSSSS